MSQADITEVSWELTDEHTNGLFTGISTPLQNPWTDPPPVTTKMKHLAHAITGAGGWEMILEVEHGVMEPLHRYPVSIIVGD